MKHLPEIDCPQDLHRLSIGELPEVAAELRELIMETISTNGGHLGAAMGVVELTTALHYVFESPKDRIIWDVGHQAHAHKILTGRRDRFHTIKCEGGLSGFLKRSESPHDIFGAGHASTSLSAAVGVREALRLKDGQGKVVAVIGDGGLTGGMAFEALNNAGANKRDLVVVLNDNGMSISPNVGALSEWFSRKLTGESMTRWRRRIRQVLESFEGPGQDAIRVVEHVMDATRHVLLTPGVLFEGLGFEYIGPIDGHDIPTLVKTLRNARALGKPVVVHAKTRKGEGVPGVEKDIERFHGVKPFDRRSGRPKPAKAAPPSYTSVFSKTVCELAAADPRVVAITAAMPQGTGLVEFSKRFPERFYDVGIAEQHAVTFAAGLACEGFRPICAIYSTFLQRAFDQVVHDVCLQKLPVVFCLDRAGLVGADGPTHHGVFDISYLRLIPDLAIVAPRDEDQLRHCLATAVRANRPTAVRWPRGAGQGVPMQGLPEALAWPKAEVLFEKGDDVLFLAAGPLVHCALEAARTLETEGVMATVIDPRFLKPLDEETLLPYLRRTRAVITAEDNVLNGGFGSSILELCEGHGLHKAIRRLGLPDAFVTHGNVDRLYARYGLNAQGMIDAFKRLPRPEFAPVLSIATRQ